MQGIECLKTFLLQCFGSFYFLIAYVDKFPDEATQQFYTG